MDISALGFFAASFSVVAFGSQYIHIIKKKTISGISINRTVLDACSLTLWVAYAARLEDVPLLIATSFELTTGLAVLVIIVRARNRPQIKDFTPPQSQNNSEDNVIIDIRSRSHSI